MTDYGFVPDSVSAASRPDSRFFPWATDISELGRPRDNVHPVRDGEDIPGLDGGGLADSDTRGESVKGIGVQRCQGGSGRDYQGCGPGYGFASRAVERVYGSDGKITGFGFADGGEVTKLLAEMSGEELAEVLKAAADRLHETLDINRDVIDQLRKAAEELEAKRENDA